MTYFRSHIVRLLVVASFLGIALAMATTAAAAPDPSIFRVLLATPGRSVVLCLPGQQRSEASTALQQATSVPGTLAVVHAYGGGLCADQQISSAEQTAQQALANRAGLVIDFGDGRVVTFCIDLGSDGQMTGEELLLASNLPVVIEYMSGVGGAVCSIDGVGANYPAEACFAKCTMKPGETCLYWAYSQLQSTGWVASSLGASSTTITAGAVDGWAWGKGNRSTGSSPPQTEAYTFSAICAAAANTATPTATTAPTATATATPTSTTAPTATTAAQPTATRSASTSPTPVVVTVAAQPTSASSKATARPTATSAPTRTPIRAATATTSSQPSPTPEPTEMPAATATVAVVAEAPTEGPTLAPTVAVVAEAPTKQPTSTPTAVAVAALPTDDQGQTWLPMVEGQQPTDAALFTRTAASPTALPQPTALPTAEPAGGATTVTSAPPMTWWGYGVLALAALIGGATLIWLGRRRWPNLLSLTIYGLSSVIGVIAFVSPFFSATVQQNTSQLGGSSSAPLLLTVLLGLCFLALLFEVQGTMLGAKSVALLGILVAINSTLRFAEVAIPGPGGFTPVFMLIILVGYVYGGTFGFLMGTMTMFVSALITGGVGPWLPYQMFTAGWVGLSTALLPPLVRRLNIQGRVAEVIVLAVFGALWGFAYGAIMNLSFWPFSAGAAEQYWTPGITPLETLRRYFNFYLLTSFVWDIFGALGNVVLIALFGAPILRTLRRFHDRLLFVYRPETPTTAPAPLQQRERGSL